MGVLVFPLLYISIFGQGFNLINYRFVPVNPYGEIDVKNYTVKTEIEVFDSKFQMATSSLELANFLGANVVTLLKQEKSYPYGNSYFNKLPLIDGRKKYKKVTIAIRMSLKTEIETVPVYTPTSDAWELERVVFGGPHYLKTLIKGAEVHSIIEMNANNRTHFEQIRRAVERELGYNGTFDEHFHENLEKVVRETGTWYSVTSTTTKGIRFGFYLTIPLLLEIKNDLEGNRSVLYSDVAIHHEFNSLSEISSSVPLVEIKKEFIEQAERLQLIYEDVFYAFDEFLGFLFNRKINFTDEKVESLETELSSMLRSIDELVSGIDVTTGGDVHQFDDVFAKYGSSDTDKYRNLVHQLRVSAKIE